MTRRLPCPAAPGPLEDYAARFRDLFHSLAQRRGFRGVPGRFAGAAGPEQDADGAGRGGTGGRGAASGGAAAAVLLVQSRWDPERVNTRRLELLAADPATAPHGGGVLVIDDSGDRKDGKTAHVAGSGWAGMARPTMAWSPSPRCGPMSGCITRCMRCPIRRPGTSRRARTTRRSAPSCSTAVPRSFEGFGRDSW